MVDRNIVGPEDRQVIVIQRLHSLPDSAVQHILERNDANITFFRQV